MVLKCLTLLIDNSKGIERSKKEMLKILRGKDYNNIYFKTSALSVLRTGVYAGNPFTEDIKPVNKIKDIPPSKFINDPNLWEEDLDHFLILEKVN